MSDTMVDPVHSTSLTSATGYIFNILFTSQSAHHIAENWRSLFSLDLLFAITAKIPASSGNTSIHVAKVRIENNVTAMVKEIAVSLCDTHVHFPFIE